ncbi:MAG: hypothetical protein ACKVRN_03710 [Pyrinomonadaceae bacterium]
MNKKELKQIEMKEDGKETERFLALAKQVISVPKAEIDRRLAEQKKQKKAKS